MSLRNITTAVVAAALLAVQLGCYNTYTIDQDELRKLEASVDRYETVEVLADCPGGTTTEQEGDASLHGERFADAEAADEGEDVVADAMTKSVDRDDVGGCTVVPVSTVNALTVLTTGGDQRVTPFNFVMDDVQLVSPEYDVLVQLDQVEGAEVREFSAWKTAATIAGVSALTIGTFVGVSLLAPDEEGF